MVARQSAPRTASAAQASFFTRPFMRSPSVGTGRVALAALGGQCANDAALQERAKTLVVGRAEGLPERDLVGAASAASFFPTTPASPRRSGGSRDRVPRARHRGFRRSCEDVGRLRPWKAGG